MSGSQFGNALSEVRWNPGAGLLTFDLLGNTILVAPGGQGTTAQRPVNAATGVQFFDTTLGIPIWAFNGGWVNAAGVAV